MTAKEFILNDLNAEKVNLINTLRKSNLSQEEKDIVNSKIDSIEARIEKANSLVEDSNVNEKIDALNSKLNAVSEKMNAKGVVMNLSEGNSYLDSKNAIKDFAQAMRNAKKENVNFHDEWNGMLAKNGITIASGSEDAYLPTPVKGYIEDAWRQYGDVLGEFFNTGAKAFYVRYTSQQQHDLAVRAKGHKKGQTKVEQEVTLSAFLIQSEYVYKLIPVSNKTIWDDDVMLIQWVLNELLRQWNYEVLRAILIGDGRQVSDNDHITSIEPVTASGFTTTINYDSTKTLIEQVVESMVEQIYDGENDIILFTSKAVFSELRKSINGTGATPVYMSAEDTAAMIGVKRIVTVPYLSDTNGSSTEVIAIAVKAGKYAVTGSLTPDFYSWEDPKTNETYFRVEVPVGGALAAPESAVVMMGAE